MGAIGGEELMNWEKMSGIGGEEKILVLVRLRPLSEKEIARDEVADWECINANTILYRNSLQERSGLPTAYTFDRVFRGDCTTREVYEEGTKDIALSVVGGVNSTIFAYGQTSSGKTYTMNGITEYTVADIYDYIEKHEERAFVLKFSAIEIYNEVVRDLLSTDNTPLRMLDDPERGTIIEKLTEETLRDWSHLKELLSICEAQRKIGETSLNETSSRSHQILRLTIESSAREFLGKDNSTTLAATVNFVDLAGSERASQALSVGQRLKEGCHINRSLLTLGTVIRKLSKGRQGHVNYRDSKLTRILQPALGGNARTAIICTLSPARSHVEQSRNTLLFASCAKEVRTNAQVNVLMSDKALVKQLQKEVARLESELRTPVPTCDHAPLLRKKDMQIEKLEKQVRELTKQRDLAESRIQDLLKEVANVKTSGQLTAVSHPPNWQEDNLSEDELSVTESSCGADRRYSNMAVRKHNRVRASNEENKSNGVSGPPHSEDSSNHASSDDFCKEVRCIETDEQGQENISESPGLSASENEERMSRSSVAGNGNVEGQELFSTLASQVSSVENGPYEMLEQKLHDVQKTINSLASPYPGELSPRTTSIDMAASGSHDMAKSESYQGNLSNASPYSDMEEESESTPPTGLEKSYPGRPEGFQRKHWKLPPSIYGADSMRLHRNDSQSSLGSAFMDDVNAQINNHGDEDIPTLGSFVAGLREMAKLQYENRIGDQVLEVGQRVENNAKDIESDLVQDSLESPSDWPMKFERLQRFIIDLWQTCNVSFVHRTYFYLLFKGDLTDSIYMEVEYRRLSFLKETFSKGNPAVQDGRTLTLASSIKALRRERETLSHLMYKKYTEDERNRIYQKWGVSLTSKRRRVQLMNRLWSSTKDMNHIMESAAIVAKLIGFSEQGQALKEMFGLSFTPPRLGRRSFRWKNSMASLL